MHISHIRIENILGIEHLEFDAGQFNTITGPNGTGKTSVLEAVKAALRTGTDATLLRNGATRGEVVLVLDNGGTITRRVTEAGSTTKVAGADGKTSSKPASALQQLTDLLSVNPVDFLLAPKKDRARYLLESMPLVVDTEKLAGITGTTVTAPEGTHALQVIDAARQHVYDERTGTNRAVREKEATINQLRAAMPDAPGGAEGNEDALDAKIRDADAARTAELERINNKLSGIRADHAAKATALRAEAQERIDAIKAELETSLRDQDDKLRQIEGLASQQRERAITLHTETTAPLSQALSAIRANRDAAAKRQTTIETIATLEAELATLVSDAAKQSAAITAVDQYKLDLLAALPIPGLEVREGEIFRDGVAFDRLNTAQQVQIAVDLAKLRAGRLGVICCDRMESLDDATFAEFKRAAIESDLQLFVTRVQNSGFAIDSAP